MEMTFMKGLIAAGVDTHFIYCNRSFASFCTSMECAGKSLFSDSAEKEEICRACVGNSGVIAGLQGLSAHEIGKFISANDISLAEQALTGISRDNFELWVDGIPFHEVATYEIILRFKLKKVQFDEDQYQFYLATLKNCLICYYGASRILDSINPQHVIIYSPQYAINHAFAKAAAKRNIPTYFIEGSDNIAHRYSATRVWKWDAFQLVNPSKSYWETYEKCAFPPEAYSRVSDHFRELIKGTSFSVYSEPKKSAFNLRNYYNFPENARIGLLAMSSHDEAFAAYYIGAFPEEKVKSKVYGDQVDWVRKTISFYSRHPDQYLVIRIHPRDFPNKREGVMSPQYRDLQDYFRNELPSNVRVNWPADKVSIYNLFEQVDYLITGWSATTLEGSLYNLPVILYDRNLPSYPTASFFTGVTEEEYFLNLDKAMRGELQGDPHMAVHWWALNHYLNTVDAEKTPGHKLFRKMGYKIVRLLKLARINAYDYGDVDKVADRMFLRLTPDSVNRLLELLQRKMDSILDPSISVNREILQNKNEDIQKERIEKELSVIRQYLGKAT